MEKLINSINRLRKNSKKGFTLVELIVVIVIIAILIASLSQAVLGVIERANQVSDEAEARSVMTAASVWALGSKTPPTNDTINLASIVAEIQGGVPITTGNIKAIYFDGFICTQVIYSRQAKNPVIVGDHAEKATAGYHI